MNPLGIWLEIHFCLREQLGENYVYIGFRRAPRNSQSVFLIIYTSREKNFISILVLGNKRYTRMCMDSYM